MKKIVLFFAVLFLSACGTYSKVIPLDPVTGIFPAKKQATVLTSQDFDIDGRKALVVVPNSVFDEAMVKNLEYFDEVVTVEGLETIIVRNDLGDKVPSIVGKIGISNAAKHYKPFLWIRYDRKNLGGKKYYHFILTDPLTLEDYFVAETYMDYGLGISDQNNWYPLYNALIEYIKTNSASYN